jgi:hypothetical protein
MSETYEFRYFSTVSRCHGISEDVSCLFSELSWMIFGTWLSDNYCLNLRSKNNYCLTFHRCFGVEVLEGYGMNYGDILHHIYNGY